MLKIHKDNGEDRFELEVTCEKPLLLIGAIVGPFVIPILAHWLYDGISVSDYMVMYLLLVLFILPFGSYGLSYIKNKGKSKKEESKGEIE